MHQDSDTVSLDIPQCCKAKLTTFLQLGHQQGITSISEIKKKERKIFRAL
jgi:hypothetical protein